MNTPSAATIDLPPELEAKIQFDQLKLTLLGLKPIGWIVPALALATTIAFSGWIPWPRLLIWFLLATVTTIPHIQLTRQFLDQAASSTRTIRSWNRIFCFTYALFGSGWSSLTFFLWAPGDDINHCVILLILGCSVGSTSTFFSPSRPLTRTAFTVYGLPFLISPLFAESRAFHALPLLILPYLAFLLHVSNQARTQTRKILLLRYDHDELLASQRRLIGELDAAKTFAESARDQAENANRSKSQFLASVSHELRTPLNAILGFSEIMKIRLLGDDIDRNTEYAGLIHSSGQYLLALIDDVLDLAKIEAGRFELAESQFDLAGLIAEALRLTEQRALTGECVLVNAMEPGLPEILADRRSLKQVILNLLSNAIKFTPPGGTVTAFARRLPDGRVSFGVADTGVGIAPEDQHKVFEKFGQGRHAYTPKERGTGLGLCVVRGLIELHGGEVTLQSAVGKGTTVTIDLPLLRSQVKEAVSSVEKPAPLPIAVPA